MVHDGGGPAWVAFLSRGTAVLRYIELYLSILSILLIAFRNMGLGYSQYISYFITVLCMHISLMNPQCNLLWLLNLVHKFSDRPNFDRIQINV